MLTINKLILFKRKACHRGTKNIHISCSSCVEKTILCSVCVFSGSYLWGLLRECVSPWSSLRICWVEWRRSAGRSLFLLALISFHWSSSASRLAVFECDGVVWWSLIDWTDFDVEFSLQWDLRCQFCWQTRNKYHMKQFLPYDNNRGTAHLVSTLKQTPKESHYSHESVILGFWCNSIVTVRNCAMVLMSREQSYFKCKCIYIYIFYLWAIPVRYGYISASKCLR